MSKPKTKKVAPKGVGNTDTPVVEPVKPRLTTVARAAGVPKPAPDQPIDEDDEDFLDADDLAANDASLDARDEPPQPNPCRWKTDGFDPPSSFARPLALEITRRAVDEWKAAKALWARSQRKMNAFHKQKPSAATKDDYGDFTAWEGAMCRFAWDAERRLAACVLLVHGLIEDTTEADKMPAGWNPVALSLCGNIYIVEPKDADRFDFAPRLIVVGRGGFDDDDFGSPTY